MKITMTDTIIKFFSPLVDSNDVMWTLRSRVVNALLNSLILFGLAITVLGFFTDSIPKLTYFLDASLVPASILIRSVYREGRIHRSAAYFMALGFIVITGVIIDMGSVFSPATATFIILIVLASLLFGKNGGLVTAFASTVIVYGLIELDSRTNLMQIPFVESESALPSAITYGLLFGAVGMILNWIFERLLQDQAKLKGLNDELEERVAKRTHELEQSRDELKIANVELVRADKMKDEFLATMSHELRTPLTGILGLTEAIRYKVYGELTEKQDELLVNVQNSGQHLLTMINDILDLSKIQANKMELETSMFQVSSVCAASAQMVKGMANKKNINITIDVAPADLVMLADQKRVKQALVNLLSNAIKFTPNDGKVGLAVKLESENERVMFKVWDTGIGITSEDQKKLFQPFVQIDSGLSRGNAGTGLGLFLVRKLAEIQGGGVSMESTPGEGSNFTITLPWKQFDTQNGNLNDSINGLLPEIEVDKILIIILVDDHAQSLETLTDELRFIGHTVYPFNNATDAIKFLVSRSADLIITDIQMPNMDGIEFTKQVRALLDPTVNMIPIIALTALAMPGDEKRCLGAGMNIYLTKPISLSELSASISLLGK